MSQAWAKPFYNSSACKKCRASYIVSVNGLCERCLSKNRLRPGYIVHHKITLTLTNIHDVNVTLNHDNLYYVCKDCHEEEHHGECEIIREGLMFNERGEVVQS